MKYSTFGAIAVVLAAGLYFYLRSTSSANDESLASRATKALENTAAELETPPLIGSLRSRQHTIHMYVGKFTVEDANGKVLAQLVNENQFSRLLPELFDDFKKMYANEQMTADILVPDELSQGWSYSAAPTRTITAP